MITTIAVGGPVDAYDLFAHVRTLLGLPLDGRWNLTEHGPVHMLQTLPGQDAPAVAAVHFRVDGGHHPGDPTAGIPGGYALLTFTTSDGDAQTGQWHRHLAARTGEWLSHRGLRWTSSVTGAMGALASAAPRTGRPERADNPPPAGEDHGLRRS